MEIVKKTYKTLPWGGRWAECFGLPEENSTWFISGSSAGGKSSFAMQLAYELTFDMDKRQGQFRVMTSDTVEDLTARLKKRHSAKFIIIDSFQQAGWEWLETLALVKAFPRKSFIFISQEVKSQPLGKAAVRLRYLAGVKVRVVGFRAYCQGRFNQESGNSFVVWEDGIIRTTNNLL